MNDNLVEISGLPNKINLLDLQPFCDALAQAFGGKWYPSGLTCDFDKGHTEDITITKIKQRT